MANPQRYPAGISTFPIQHIQNTFPTTTNQWQISKGDDFIPFRQSTDYTATTGGTGATAAAFPWVGGAVKVISGSTTPFTSFEALGANSMMIIPGNQTWFDTRIGAPTGTMVNPTNDSVIYTGFFDSVSPLTATNGLYFIKPAGGTSVNFVLLKGGVATTFSNIGDLAKPSGVFGDATAVPAVLAFNTSGTTFTNVTVTTAGSGYRTAPLIVPFGTAGSGGAVYAQLGGATQGTGQGSGAPINSPYIIGAGSGYTAGTLGADIIPWINFQMWYTGKGNLMVGINGRTLLNLGLGGQGIAVPGNTYNLATVGFNSFNFTGTALTTGVAPVQPTPGDFYHAAPQSTMQLAFGLVGTTLNNRAMFVEEINIATELN